jgi:hypothetical protein
MAIPLLWVHQSWTLSRVQWRIGAGSANPLGLNIYNSSATSNPSGRWHAGQSRTNCGPQALCGDERVSRIGDSDTKYRVTVLARDRTRLNKQTGRETSCVTASSLH